MNRVIVNSRQVSRIVLLLRPLSIVMLNIMISGFTIKFRVNLMRMGYMKLAYSDIDEMKCQEFDLLHCLNRSYCVLHVCWSLY